MSRRHAPAPADRQENIEVAAARDDLLHRQRRIRPRARRRELSRRTPSPATSNKHLLALGDKRQDDRAVRFEIAHRVFLVAPHEARVPGDVRSQDGREPPFVNWNV